MKSLRGPMKLIRLTRDKFLYLEIKTKLLYIVSPNMGEEDLLSTITSLTGK
jgi:hypothetical protein